MTAQKKRDIREAILDIIDRQTESSIYYLQKNLDNRKSIEGDVLFTDILQEIYHLDRKELVRYLGHGIYELTEKGKIKANE